jgi:exoribonuclease R
MRSIAPFAVLALAAGAQERSNDEPPTFRAETELTVKIGPPQALNAQCAAEYSSTYDQRNTLARVETTIRVQACTVASGEFTVTLRVRGEDGEVKMLTLDETWARTDDKDVSLVADYAIGESVELVSARVRGRRCTCADPPAEP